MPNALGDPDNPIPYSDQVKRFKNIVSVIGWSKEKISGIVNNVLGLEKIDDIETLMTYL
jgi:hypothetical protein